MQVFVHKMIGKCRQQEIRNTYIYTVSKKTGPPLDFQMTQTNLVQYKQEVWPPGSADTACPRQPLMTQVQHCAKTLRLIR